MRFLTTCLLISTFSLLGFKTDSVIGYEVGDKAINFELINASKTVNGLDKTVNLDDYKFPIQSLVPETCGKNNSSNFTLSPGLMVSGIDPNFTASNEENNYYNSNLFTDHH